MASHHYDYHRSRRHAPPTYSPSGHTEWTFRMRHYLRAEHPLGLQICEGEITIEHDPKPYDHAASEAATSLALTRSQSYSLTDGSDFRSLFAGAPVDEDPDRGAVQRHDSDATTRYNPMAEAQKPDGDPTSGVMDTAMPPKGDEGRMDGPDRGARAKQARALRRSPRLRATEGKQPEGRSGPSATVSATHVADVSAAGASTEGGGDEGSAGKEGSQDGDGGDDDKDKDSGDGNAGDLRPAPGTSAPGGDRGPYRGPTPADESHEARVERLEFKIYQLKKHARTEAGQIKTLVSRAKAVAMLLRQTIDPDLWSRLPAGIRREAFNQANAKVWGVLQISLGYAHNHLIGQLSEGDGKGAWDRLVHLHAEETNGAQAHYLQQLMTCSYERVARTRECGFVRLYAEALQRVNQLYRLAAGHHVQPSILMCRLLTLPGGYDPIVENIEQINSQRAANGGHLEPLDFHEVLQKIVQFENRVARRRGERKVFRQFPHAKARRHQKPRGRPGRAYVAQTGRTGRQDRDVICWRCGKPGHYARECREDVSAADAARGQQARPMPKANLARSGRNQSHNGRGRGSGRNRGPRRGRKPAIGFLAVEYPSQALVAKQDRTAEEGTVIIDSGASGSFCVTGTPLKNARVTRRTISSAGSQTLIGRAVGDWGCLRNAVALKGLRKGLASVGSIADDYQATLLFTPTKVYAIPIGDLNQHLQAQYVIGRRDDTGLYIGNVQQMTEVLTAKRGFQTPCTKAAVALTALERRAAEGQPGHYALTVQQETMEQARVQIPGRARSPSGQLGRAGRLQRRDPERTVGVHSLKQTVRGVRPRHPMSVRTTSGGCGAPDIRREGHGKPQHRRVQFTDTYCDTRGHVSPGSPEERAPVAPVDSCTKLAAHTQEHTFPAERENLMEGEAQSTKPDKHKGIVARLFGSPHTEPSEADLEALSEMLHDKKLAEWDWSEGPPVPTHTTGGEPMTPLDARADPAARTRSTIEKRLSCRHPVGVFLQTTQLSSPSEGTSGETSRTDAPLPLPPGPQAPARHAAAATEVNGRRRAPPENSDKENKKPPLRNCATDTAPELPREPERFKRRRARHYNMKIHSDTIHIVVPSLRGKCTHLRVLVDDHTRYAWSLAFRADESMDRKDAKTWATIRNTGPPTGPHTYTVTGLGRPVLRRSTGPAPRAAERRQMSRLANDEDDNDVNSPPAEFSNSIARQAIRNLLILAKSLLVGAELPICFWAEASEMAVDIYNRTGHAANGGLSPYEMYYGRPSDDDRRIKNFGCVCYATKTTKKTRAQLYATASPCVHMGKSKYRYDCGSIFNPRTQNFETRPYDSVTLLPDQPGGGKVRDCGVVKKRMKTLVGIKQPAQETREQSDQRARRAQPVPASTDGTWKTYGDITPELPTVYTEFVLPIRERVSSFGEVVHVALTRFVKMADKAARCRYSLTARASALDADARHWRQSRLRQLAKMGWDAYCVASTAARLDLARSMAHDMTICELYDQDALERGVRESAAAWSFAVERYSYSIPRRSDRHTKWSLIAELKDAILASAFKDMYCMDHFPAHPTGRHRSWRKEPWFNKPTQRHRVGMPWTKHMRGLEDNSLRRGRSTAPASDLEGTNQGPRVPSKGPHSWPRVLRLRHCLYNLDPRDPQRREKIGRSLLNKGFLRSTDNPRLYNKTSGDGSVRLELHEDDCCALWEDETSRNAISVYQEAHADTDSGDKTFLGTLIEWPGTYGTQAYCLDVCAALALQSAARPGQDRHPPQGKSAPAEEQGPDTQVGERPAADNPTRRRAGEMAQAPPDRLLYKIVMSLMNLMTSGRSRPAPETRHSESLLVARPDSNHPGSNDAATHEAAPSDASGLTQDEWDALVHPLYGGAVLFPCPECDQLCHRDSYIATDFVALKGEIENSDAFTSRLGIETEALEEVLTPDTTLSDLLENAVEWIMCSPNYGYDEHVALHHIKLAQEALRGTPRDVTLGKWLGQAQAADTRNCGHHFMCKHHAIYRLPTDVNLLDERNFAPGGAAADMEVDKGFTDADALAHEGGHCMICLDSTPHVLRHAAQSQQLQEEIDEKLDPSQVRKHSVSLLVARPDTNHPGSNDSMASQPTTQSHHLTGIELQRATVAKLQNWNEQLLRRQAELEEEWSDRHGGVYYADSSERDPAIDHVREERGRVGTRLAHAEQVYRRASARRQAIVEAITSGIRKRIDDIVMRTMDIGLRDVLNDTLVAVTHPKRGFAFHPIDLMNSMTAQGWAPIEGASPAVYMGATTPMGH